MFARNQTHYLGINSTKLSYILSISVCVCAIVESLQHNLQKAELEICVCGREGLIHTQHWPRRMHARPIIVWTQFIDYLSMGEQNRVKAS